jgi:hypothetical protein
MTETSSGEGQRKEVYYTAQAATAKGTGSTSAHFGGTDKSFRLK